MYAGALEDGEKFLRPLREHESKVVDTFQPMPYNGAQRMADFLWPAGLYNYWKSSFLTTLSDAAIDVFVDWFARVPSKRTVIVLEHNGDSAWDRVPDGATAFGSRAWPYNFVVTSPGRIHRKANRTYRGRADSSRPWAHTWLREPTWSISAATKAWRD